MSNADDSEDVMELNGFPYAEIDFGTDGLPVDAAQRGAAPPLAVDPAVTDLLVICHGFLENIPGARSLYQQLTASIARVGGAPRGLGVLGLMWPSEQFGVSAPAQVAALTQDPSRRAAFVESVRAQLPKVSAAEPDPGDGQHEFCTLAPEAVFDRLSAGSTTGRVERGVTDVLNLATYYRMKARAGLVGTVGLAPILAAARHARLDLRLHLVGHSFGARVVSAAVAAGPALPVDSMTLLQGAFTHYGFARQWDGKHDGVFRAAVEGGRVRGPLTVTYSAHDDVLRLAYALASRLARQDDIVVPGIGGSHDKYGAIGANGALRTPEARWLTMPAVGAASPLTAGAVCNLDSSAYIGSHFAVTGPEVAQSVLFGMWRP